MSPDPRSTERRRENRERDYPAVLREFIEPLLPRGAPRIEAAAQFLSLSPRSLHRRLSTRGLTWRGLLDQVRREKALRRLRDPDLPIVEIALSLGYSDQAHFTRAFRRWMGLGPRAYRACQGDENDRYRERQSDLAEDREA